MEGTIQVELPPSKRRRSGSMNRDLCVLCQNETREALVQESKSGHKLCEALYLRQQCENTEFQQAADLVQHIDDQKFIDEKWHLSCYKLCTHKVTLTSVRIRHEKQQSLATTPDSECSTKHPVTIDTPLTRSHGARLEKTTCFFCDKIESRGHALHLVSTHDVGKKIHAAVELSDNVAW